MAYLILDSRAGTVSLCRAGHDAPLHYKAAERAVYPIKPPGMALGIDSGATFDRVTADFDLKLESGDCLILYTDGLTEAMDPSGAEFGIDRTVQTIQSSAANGANAVIDRLISEVRSFIGDQPKHDDITLIVIRKT
jgi:sigma-B regulation protein RsbU (phosphoserine phosphatase)